MFCDTTALSIQQVDTMILRRAIPADIPEMFRVRTNVRENPMSIAEMAAVGITADSIEAMLAGSVRGWVMQEGDGLAAFALADSEDGCVFALFVDRGHEGKGLGRQLMKEVEAWLFSFGLQEIWLETDVDVRVRANGFYRHMGWQEAGLQDDGQARFVKRA
ncbi:GNAT family N-acetyltransferase [Alcaligenaceae bacterium C4P045]|nr:GNAT family N-acetyltransferase [Alcaligenaceae bacterium C4P045]